MKPATSVLLLSTSLLFLLMGCATTSTMRTVPLSDGVARSFDADFDTVVDATRDAVADAGLAIEDAYSPDDSTYVIIGRSRSSAFSYGGYARAVVEKETADRTTVRVVTRRKVATNVTAKGDYSDSIFATLGVKFR